MKNDRLSSEESMTFTKVQIYLILGCIVAIAVLSFSLGHLVSRKSTPDEPVAEVVYGSDRVAEEAMEELSRLEERLDAVKTYPSEDGVTEGEPTGEPPQPGADVSIVKIEPVIESPPQSEQKPEPAAKTAVIQKAEPKPVRVKSLEGSVAKVARTPVVKPVNVKKKLVKKKASKGKSKKPRATTTKRSAQGVGLTESRVVKPKLPPMPPQPTFSAGAKSKPKSASKSKKSKAKKIDGVPSDSKYTIQVATYPSREEAEKVKKKLKSKGYKAYVHTLARSRSVWYRVRVGGYKSKDEAVDTIVDLREKEGFQAVIDRYQKAP